MNRQKTSSQKTTLHRPIRVFREAKARIRNLDPNYLMLNDVNVKLQGTAFYLNLIALPGKQTTPPNGIGNCVLQVLETLEIGEYDIRNCVALYLLLQKYTPIISVFTFICVFYYKLSVKLADLLVRY